MSVSSWRNDRKPVALWLACMAEKSAQLHTLPYYLGTKPDEAQECHFVVRHDLLDGDQAPGTYCLEP